MLEKCKNVFFSFLQTSHTFFLFATSFGTLHTHSKYVASEIVEGRYFPFFFLFHKTQQCWTSSWSSEWVANELFMLSGSQGGHLADPASRPKEALLPDPDSHHNQSQRTQHSLTYPLQQNGRDSPSLLDDRAERLSATDAQLDGVTPAGTHSLLTELATGTSSDKSIAVLVQVQQVSAVHTANTERYEEKAARDSTTLGCRVLT